MQPALKTVNFLLLLSHWHFTR